jgi:hypothetical protein
MQNDMRDRLEQLIKQAEHQEALDFFSADLDEQIDMSGDIKVCIGLEYLAQYLIANGVIVPPCKVGDILYRIDNRIKHCSLHHMYSKGNHYTCVKDYNCFLYDTPACDCGEEYYIYEIKTQNIETIVCNMRQLGETVFLTKEQAEQKLKELSGNGKIY